MHRLVLIFEPMDTNFGGMHRLVRTSHSTVGSKIQFMMMTARGRGVTKQKLICSVMVYRSVLYNIYSK